MVSWFFPTQKIEKKSTLIIRGKERSALFFSYATRWAAEKNN